MVFLHDPSQNSLVDRFDKVLSKKLKEYARFIWNSRSVLASFIVDYRSTPLSTTCISPFGVIFGR